MSNTPEMVRLLRHAADLLEAAADNSGGMRVAIEKVTYGDEKSRLVNATLPMFAAMVNAKATLRLFSAALEDEPEPAVKPSMPGRAPNGRFLPRGDS